MDADYSSGDQRRRRRKREDDDPGYESERKRRHHEEDFDRRKRRERSRSRQRERSGRSRSPDSSSRRTRGGDTEKDREKVRERRRRSRSTDYRSSRRHRDWDDERDDGHKERRRRRRDHHGEHRKRRTSQTARLDSSDSVDETVDKNLSVVKRGGPLPSQDESFAVSRGEEPEKPKEQPNFGNTGLLAAASNQVTQEDGSTITLKYHEPPEARKPAPRDQWKLFVFKGPDIIDTIDLSARSCWLVGRETAIVDLPAEHPSISKQHAVVQFRYIEKRNDFGDKIGKVKPYLIDLESANGTMLNKDKVPSSRYLELRDKDMVQFGLSTREYVLMLAPR